MGKKDAIVEQLVGHFGGANELSSAMFSL